MKLFKWGKDGGPESGVWGFWLIEIKALFSIVLLRFEADNREAYHSHAFNAFTWWLAGEVEERHVDGRIMRWRPSVLPKYTPRSCFHKVIPLKRTWALSIRGPWSKHWFEFRKDRKELTTLTNGRRIVKTRTVPAEKSIKVPPSGVEVFPSDIEETVKLALEGVSLRGPFSYTYMARIAEGGLTFKQACQLMGREG